MPTANFRLKIKLQGDYKFSSLRVLYENVDKFNVKAKKDMPDLTWTQGETFKTILQGELSESGSGITWTIPPGAGWWEREYSIPSAAPGEPPVDQTGELKNSIRVVRQAAFNAAVEIGVGMQRDYASYLEYGGWTSCFGKGPIAERPWVRPTWDAYQDHIRDVGRDYFIHRTWGAVW